MLFEGGNTGKLLVRVSLEELSGGTAELRG